jgi:hypothetical protein
MPMPWELLDSGATLVFATAVYWELRVLRGELTRVLTVMLERHEA